MMQLSALASSRQIYTFVESGAGELLHGLRSRLYFSDTGVDGDNYGAIDYW